MRIRKEKTLKQWRSVFMLFFSVSISMSGLNRCSDLEKIGKEIDEESTEFSAGKTTDECIIEAVSRYKKDRSFMGQVRSKVFLRMCLKKTKLSGNFCEGTPGYGSIFKSVRWSADECKRIGLANDEGCTRIVREKIDFCSNSNRKKK